MKKILYVILFVVDMLLIPFALVGMYIYMNIFMIKCAIDWNDSVKENIILANKAFFPLFINSYKHGIICHKERIFGAA